MRLHSDGVDETSTGRTVGQAAEAVGVTVRTLHHYDEIGLLSPSVRSTGGYRLYDEVDVARLRTIVVYRRLGFSLDEVRTLLHDPDADVAEHLRRQRAVLVTRLDETRALLSAVDRALEAEMTGMRLTPEEQRELFGEEWSDELTREAQQRWGETDAWQQSQQRTRAYERNDWTRIKAEAEQIEQRFVDLMASGVAPDSAEALSLARAHRDHITRWFYDCAPQVHRSLGEMYVADPRFTAHYDRRAPGLAAYVSAAIITAADDS